MERRPVIGITAMVERAAWTVWNAIEVNVSQRTYSRGVSESGGLPVLLAADELSAESPDQLLDLLDGLVLAGGADIDPTSYGAAPDPHTKGARIERDRFELALCHGALARDLPVLGICRGMQLLNVACGGTLEQHLPDAERHLHTPGRFSDHDVRLAPGSRAAHAVGAQRVAVRSHHHQGVGRLGEGLVATGWADPGETVEAIETTGDAWALGILWHAEEQGHSPVLQALVNATRVEVGA